MSQKAVVTLLPVHLVETLSIVIAFMSLLHNNIFFFFGRTFNVFSVILQNNELLASAVQ